MIAFSSPSRNRATAAAYNRLVARYYGFVRLKASSYFLAGGDSDDLIQEGLVGLYKAIRDYRSDRESSFRNFAELCITRQIITAVKTATRNKHTPLNQYVSFSSTPAGGRERTRRRSTNCSPGPSVNDPVNKVISSEELRSLVGCLSTALSELETACSRSTSTGAPTSRWAASSAATPRPSTTHCSGSSGRSARTSSRASAPDALRRVLTPAAPPTWQRRHGGHRWTLPHPRGHSAGSGVVSTAVWMTAVTSRRTCRPAEALKVGAGGDRDREGAPLAAPWFSGPPG